LVGLGFSPNAKRFFWIAPVFQRLISVFGLTLADPFFQRSRLLQYPGRRFACITATIQTRSGWSRYSWFSQRVLRKQYPALFRFGYHRRGDRSRSPMPFLSEGRSGMTTPALIVPAKNIQNRRFSASMFALFLMFCAFLQFSGSDWMALGTSGGSPHRLVPVSSARGQPTWNGLVINGGKGGVSVLIFGTDKVCPDFMRSGADGTQT
jgi:hypothetical protein